MKKQYLKYAYKGLDSQKHLNLYHGQLHSPGVRLKES